MASPLARLRHALAVFTRAPSTRGADRFHEALGVLEDLSARGGAATTAARNQPPREVRVPLVFVDDETAATPAIAPLPKRRPLLPNERRHRLRLGTSVALLALIATGAVIGGVAASSHPSPTVPSHRAATTTTSATTTTTTTSTTTTTTTTLPLTVGNLSLTALSPATGAPGSEVTITGSDIASRNGSIVATFNGRTTPTACSSESRCTAEVPPGLHGVVTVVLHTSSGASNGLSFTVR